MGTRRMLSADVCESDRFLDLPASSQSLYMHLALNCDDRGFCASPRKVGRMCGASADDLTLLAAKGFVLLFDSGVCALAHWRLMNTIRKDRFTETAHLDELNMLDVQDSGLYSFAVGCQSVASRLPDGCRTVAGRLPDGCVSKEERKAIKLSQGSSEGNAIPTLEEVEAYCKEKAYTFPPERFFNYYAGIRWRKGGETIDWRATADYWQSTQKTTHTDEIHSEYTGSW